MCDDHTQKTHHTHTLAHTNTQQHTHTHREACFLYVGSSSCLWDVCVDVCVCACVLCCYRFVVAQTHKHTHTRHTRTNTQHTVVDLLFWLKFLQMRRQSSTDFCSTKFPLPSTLTHTHTHNGRHTTHTLSLSFTRVRAIDIHTRAEKEE